MKLNSNARERFRVQRYGGGPSIEGVEVAELRRFGDDGGSMVELMRLEGGEAEAPAGFSVRQVNYSCLQPGVVKAFHVHRRQADVWFVRPEDRVLLVLIDVREGSASEDRRMRLVLGDGKALRVRIPPGVAHGCRNLGARPASIVYFTDRHFSPEPERCDEGRLPWDFAGADLWEVAWE